MCKSEIMPPVFFFRRQDATHFAWIKKAQRNKINISIPLSYQISSVFIIYLGITLFSDHWNFPKV